MLLSKTLTKVTDTNSGVKYSISNKDNICVHNYIYIQRYYCRILTSCNDPRINSHSGVFWENADEPVLLGQCFLQS